jgi:3'-phosphoadenosine 5'-phosphosulfate (PAPS) 3'-phosphatase
LLTVVSLSLALGFLRGEQYAVCLTLISQGVPVLGLLACPNLPFPSLKAPTSKGSFFLATAGAGAFQRSLTLPLDLSPEATENSGTSNPFIPINLPHSSTAGPHAILESVEASHSSHAINEAISSSIEIGEHLRMDSQAKYGALARGDGEMYLRVPTKYSGGKAYQEKVWDHASGYVLVKEAGGKVGDCWGRELDFGVGRTLKSNDVRPIYLSPFDWGSGAELTPIDLALLQGVIATSSPIYDNVISAVRSAILQANPDVKAPAEAKQAAVVEDAVADEIREAEQSGAVEKGKDGIVIGEEQAAPTS